VLRLTRLLADRRALSDDPFDQALVEACAGCSESILLVRIDCGEELDAIECTYCERYFFWRRGTVTSRLWEAMRRGELTMPRYVRGLEWLRAAFAKMVQQHVAELEMMPEVGMDE
jgi:hypothetical protein